MGFEADYKNGYFIDHQKSPPEIVTPELLEQYVKELEPKLPNIKLGDDGFMSLWGPLSAIEELKSVIEGLKHFQYTLKVGYRQASRAASNVTRLAGNCRCEFFWMEREYREALEQPEPQSDKDTRPVRRFCGIRVRRGRLDKRKEEQKRDESQFPLIKEALPSVQHINRLMVELCHADCDKNVPKC